MNYDELCQCGHTRLYHAWVPDPSKPLDAQGAQRHDCQKCCCSAFDGTNYDAAHSSTARRSEVTRDHELKIWPSFFAAVASGEKRFEVRSTTDRDFSIGDTLTLLEWDPERGQMSRVLGYTGRAVRSIVTYILPGGRFGIDERTAILGLGAPEIGTYWSGTYAPLAAPRQEPE